MRSTSILIMTLSVVLAGCSGGKKDQPTAHTRNEEPPPPPPPHSTKLATSPATTGKTAKEDTFRGETLEVWIPRLESENPDTRKLAAEAIGSFGSRAGKAAEPLAKRLVWKDERGKFDLSPVRLAVAQALVDLGPAAKPAVPQLTDVLKTDKEREIRVRAARALAKVGPEAKSALPVLSTTIDDPDEPIRRTAMDALIAVDPKAQETQPVLVKALKHRDLDIAVKAEHALAKVGEPAVADLITVLKGNDPVAAARAAEALGMIGPTAKAAVPVLRSELRNRDEKVRINVSAALVRMGKDAKPATDTLLDSLSDDNSKVRANATDALKIIGPEPSMIPRLTEVLRNKDNPGHDQAATLMALIGKPAVEPLIGLLVSLEVEVLKPTIRALGDIGPDAKPAIGRIANIYEENKDPNRAESSPDLAAEAAKALKKIDPDEAAKRGIK